MLIRNINSGDSETTKREWKEKLTAGQEEQPSRIPTYRAPIPVWQINCRLLLPCQII